MDMKRTLFPLLLCLSLLARAEEAPPVLDRQGDMLLDVLVLRPLGLVATGLGAGVFVLTLPFTLPSGSMGDAACGLVADPLAYTFSRPLGDVENRTGAQGCGR